MLKQRSIKRAVLGLALGAVQATVLAIFMESLILARGTTAPTAYEVTVDHAGISSGIRSQPGLTCTWDYRLVITDTVVFDKQQREAGK